MVVEFNREHVAFGEFNDRLTADRRHRLRFIFPFLLVQDFDEPRGVLGRLYLRLLERQLRRVDGLADLLVDLGARHFGRQADRDSD